MRRALARIRSIVRFAAHGALLTACHRDECPDSKLGTSWCKGTTPVVCQTNSGDGFTHNGLAYREDCAERGLGCVVGGRYASCGFPDRSCDASDYMTSFCVDTWVAKCAASGHPVTLQDCAENAFGLGGFCVAGGDGAVCSPSAEACAADTGTQCVEGVRATCRSGVWVPEARCDGGAAASPTDASAPQP